MDEALLAEVLERLDGDETLDDDAGYFAFAACSGDAELASVLGGGEVARPDLPDPAELPEPAGAYLQAIRVEGFRGIGPSATLSLRPGPGLTLVVGRNGSGKSSFAEALELLLTGDNYRWANRPKAWREGWRNLHHGGAASIVAELAEGVPGDTIVTGSWQADGDHDDVDVAVQRTGRPKTDLDALGWARDLVAFRPFLSYNELGSMLDEGPSKLYDALKAILGLDALTVAAKRLADARLEREKHLREVRRDLAPLLERLRALDDERAQTCAAALAGREWDLATVEGVLAESAAPEAAGEIDLLRALATLHPPDEQRARTVADGLREAARRRDAVAGTDAAQADCVAGLLEAAIDFHDHHGDGACPVCGREAALDAAWHDQAACEAADMRERAAAVADARARVRATLRRAEELIDLPPQALQQALTHGIDLGTAARDWQHWWDGARTEDPVALADHIDHSYPPLAASLAQVRERAEAELERRQHEWRPLARELDAWLAEAFDARAAAKALPRVKAAEQWLKDTTATLRDERFEPIAAETIELWNLLRQHSNVELGSVVLEGSGTRRRVALEVTVDGVEGAALGVMSQGELHALALSLFLPRATLPESPFRFLVIDDPVQSMDPARVDGLARVLAEVAGERQVIVFTHDTRLPDAVRRLDLDARVVEVTRRPESVVEIRDVADPITRLLDDARALAANDDLPNGVRKRLVPGFCRLALEAACTEAYRTRTLAAGGDHAAVEQSLVEATTLTKKAALAIFGDVDRAGDVHGRLNGICKGGTHIYRAVQKGVHDGYRGTLHSLVDDAAELARALRRQ